MKIFEIRYHWTINSMRVEICFIPVYILTSQQMADTYLALNKILWKD